MESRTICKICQIFALFENLKKYLVGLRFRTFRDLIESDWHFDVRMKRKIFLLPRYEHNLVPIRLWLTS